MPSHPSDTAAPHPAAASAGDAECDQIQFGSCKAQLQTAWEEITFGFKNISFNLKRSRDLPSPPREASALRMEPSSFSNTRI